MNLTTISRKTGIPVSTIFDRLRSQEGKLIKRFTALLDFSAMGYPVRAKLFLKARPEVRDKIRAYLLIHDRVNNLWRVNNGYDLLVDCIFKDIREVEEFVEELETRFDVLDKQVFHVIEDIVNEKVLVVDTY